jgi:acyl-CoA reductase-like NAD-dependent aldehyde dehydrogenase
MKTNSEILLESLFPLSEDIPQDIRLKQPVFQRHILIDGELIEWNGPTHMVFSPVRVRKGKTEDPQPVIIGSYPLATVKEAERALHAAITAYGSGSGPWPAMTVHDRIRHLEDFTFKMLSSKEEIVKLIVWEIGKSIADAEKEFDRTVLYIDETIRAIKKLSNNSVHFTIDQDFIGQTKRVPHGVVLCMGPFNYPLNETFTTLIPALIMGNTILFKPPKHGTLLFEPLLEAFREAFPRGVVNTVYGRGRDIIPALMQSGKVDVLALIGSSKVADSLKKMHPKSNRLKSILGLDAKNAAIVLDDANLELAVKETVAGALTFNGQRCTALKILFVHSSIVDEFNRRLVEAVEKLTIGMPWINGVTITPLAEPGKPGYLKDCLENAVLNGARILNAKYGGGSVSHSLVKPAIIYPVNHKMKLYREEQFGPLIPVVAFDELQTAVDYVTTSPYGQQVSIFGRNISDIGYLIDALAGQVGRINLNAQCQRSPDTFPFNGRKDSAEGTLSVGEALLAFSVDSVVATKQNVENEHILEGIISGKWSTRLSDQLL